MSLETIKVKSSKSDSFPKTSAFYYLMKNGYILRMEAELNKTNIPLLVKANLLDPNELAPLNQDQANYRVAIFRDEILEYPEYQTRVFGIVH